MEEEEEEETDDPEDLADLIATTPRLFQLQKTFSYFYYRLVAGRDEEAHPYVQRVQGLFCKLSSVHHKSV